MLPRTNRMTKKGFPLLYRRKKTFRAGGYIFHYAPLRQGVRIAAVVKKTNPRGAASRNRLRRQMYDILRREALPHLHNIALVCPFPVESPQAELASWRKALHNLLRHLRS